MIGDLSDLGFSTSAQRFVPEYVKRGAFDLLRGFLSRSRWVAVGSATVTAATGIVAVRLLEPHLTGYLVLPLSIAFATLPCYARRGSCCRSFPSRAPSPRALNTVLARQGRAGTAFGRHERALLAPGTQRQGHLERAISGDRRKKLRRQRRLLADIAPLTLATTWDAGGIEAALQDFLVLEAGGWKGLAGTAIVSEPSVKNFVQSAVGALAAGGQARIDGLFLNGTAVAATVTLASGNTAGAGRSPTTKGSPAPRRASSSSAI